MNDVMRHPTTFAIGVAAVVALAVGAIGFSRVINQRAGELASSRNDGLPLTCVQPPLGMVGWWPGDGNANDISGDNYNGTISGGVSFGPGEVDQAFTFNGTDGEVILPDSSSAPLLNFGPSDSFTVDAWLRPDAGVLGTQRVAVSLTYVCSAESIQLILLTDGRMDFSIRDSLDNDVEATTQSSILDGQWHHFAGVRDVSNHTVTLYFDGIPIASLPDTTTGTFTRPDGQNRIGSIPVACPTDRYFCNGQIDEVEVFRRAPGVRQPDDCGRAG